MYVLRKQIRLLSEYCSFYSYKNRSILHRLDDVIIMRAAKVLTRGGLWYVEWGGATSIFY